jgi:hypothetical protein
MKGNYDLGTYSRKITSNSHAAETWFNRGLVWCYAYHHDEAATCFRKAIEADADCPMGLCCTNHLKAGVPLSPDGFILRPL